MRYDTNYKKVILVLLEQTDARTISVIKHKTEVSLMSLSNTWLKRLNDRTFSRTASQ